MATKQRLTTKRSSATMIQHQEQTRADRQCRYLLDDSRPCPEPVLGASDFCERHRDWFAADLEAYKAVGEHFRQDLREFWNRSNFYLLVQAGLLSVFVSTSNRTSRYEMAIAIALVILGEVLAVMWWLVARGSILWIREWRKQMIALDDAVDRHRCFSVVERHVNQSPFKSPSYITQFLPLVFCLVWLALLAVILFY